MSDSKQRLWQLALNRIFSAPERLSTDPDLQVAIRIQEPA